MENASGPGALPVDVLWHAAMQCFIVRYWFSVCWVVVVLALGLVYGSGLRRFCHDGSGM